MVNFTLVFSGRRSGGRARFRRPLPRKKPKYTLFGEGLQQVRSPAAAQLLDRLPDLLGPVAATDEDDVLRRHDDDVLHTDQHRSLPPTPAQLVAKDRAATGLNKDGLRPRGGIAGGVS